ncbi:MAG: inositol monophosphatase family protein [Thermodesulfobacteriota bacterium]|jgi:myo-inositol-1(or 4)-monophosphatase
MDEFVHAAQEAARQAGSLIRANWQATKEITVKTDIVDLVTNVDTAADALITAFLRKRFPAHQIIAEESARSGHESPYCWYIDPLDGTTNFAHGFPHCAVSVALAYESRVIVGVVYDPLREEMFCAGRGRGASLNGKPIRVSQAPTLEYALALTGFPYDRRKRSEFYLRFYQAFMVRTQGVRRCGSAALDLCYVACGRADVFWEWRLHPWDTAAGSLIVEEAGGRMSDFAGAAFDIHGEQTLASNGLLHQEALAVLRHVLALPPSPP